ncbi:efflux RND transporter periplasmic adaptor subunit [Lichenifustis flavocetrariae]|uniref:Efflux RND transporter periplasmic adaptor subunit n=1 Tax=Lichenifustis flavocetrariae TaxID=2949735 RepID=A0AA41Z4S1_9HYPH|nr:efflux RND transporter periplasmic adaptor subunit [Lichenifustis flavocetrariae]MCW6513057.1 efflux RND transporter periplasmic adaptor subunit [Lichenifustis flavocetrariae]
MLLLPRSGFRVTGLLRRCADVTKSAPAFLRTHRWFVLAVVVVVCLGGWQGARMWFGPGVVVDVAKRGALIETVVATGNVETLYRVIIGSQITGTVEQVLVEEGVRVTKGQPLIALESRELKAAVVQAKGAVAQAEARTRQIDELTLPTARETRKEAQATLLNAQQTFDRTSDLSRNGFATHAALDTAQRDLDVGHTQVRSAEVQVYTSSPGGSDYVMAQTQLNQARASLDTATSRLAYATISAPRDGVLITRNVERGTVAQPGNTLLVLAPDGDTQLLLAIDERNMGKLALGQHATASADAYPDKRFDAVISYINPSVDITRASVQVKLTVAAPPAYLRQDMTVSVDIEVAHSANALVLPVRSVHDGLSSDPWVMGVRNGRAYRQSVRLGLQGNTQIEVLAGIKDGDAAIPASAGVLTGQRIRPITP